MKSSSEVKAIIYQSELDFIRKWILDFQNLETGGDFFGYWNEDGIPVIKFVIGPGKSARRTSTSFYQDIEYLKVWGNLINGIDSKLRHIGAWHSHHRLSLSNPSGGDINTMRNALAGDSLSRFLISIGNINSDFSVTINGFLFIKDHPHDYVDCSWEIKPGISPIRQKLNNDPDLVETELEEEKIESPTEDTSVLDSRNNKKSLVEDQNDASVEIEKPKLEVNSFWTKPEGSKFLKKSFENISRGEYVQNPEILQLQDDRIAISFVFLGRSVRIIFPHDYPNSSPRITLRAPSDGFRLFGNLFGANKKIEKRIRMLIYSSGVINKKGTLELEHLS